MYYVETADKPSVTRKIVGLVKRADNKILVPVSKKILGERRAKWLAKRTYKVLDKTNSRKIVVSKQLQQNEIYINMLHSYGYDILDGKWLFEAISNKVLDYIAKQKNINKAETQVSVLVNNLTDYTLENIKKFSKEYKVLNIVTNHVGKLKKVQDSIYEEDGLMITVTNNKKKSLLKSNLILNIDFPKELLNKYNVLDEAIIVNIHGKMKIDKKRFNGLVINDYEINIKPEAIQQYTGATEKYFTKEIYEAEFFQNMPYKDFQKKIMMDNLELQGLYGINGKIL